MMALRRGIEEGADVLAGLYTYSCPLVRFLSGPSADAVALCIAVPARIDFSVVGADGFSPLHFLCSNKSGRAVVVEMVQSSR